eukprot:489350-Prymnesium_polylepis.1
MRGNTPRDPTEASSDPLRPNGVKQVGRVGGLAPQPEGKLRPPPSAAPSTPRRRNAPLLTSPRAVWGDVSSG